MTLTATQYLYYRRLAGCDTTELTDAMMQVDYDRAVALGQDADTTEAATMVYMLRELRGLARKKIDVRGEVENESRSQLIKNITDMLKDWAGLAGMSGEGIISMGEMTLNLNFSESDITNTWP